MNQRGRVGIETLGGVITPLSPIRLYFADAPHATGKISTVTSSWRVLLCFFIGRIIA
jgi:hypothetical protein